MSALLLLLALLGAAGVGGLARQLGAPPAAALFAALAYALHGGSVGRATGLPEMLSVALVPTALWLADRTLLGTGMRGFPDAAGVMLALLGLLYAARADEAMDVVLLVAAWALVKRPRRRHGLTMLAVALLLPLVMMRLSTIPVRDVPGGDRARLALGLFPYFRPGAALFPAEAFVGIVVLVLALVALVALPPRRTAPPAAVAGVALLGAWRPLAVDGLAAPLSVGWGTGTTLLAALGLGLALTGIEGFASVARRNVLGTLMALSGGACFHAVGLYLRGGERPGEAPTLGLGVVLATAMFAAAVAPLLPILRGGWEKRRRTLAAAVAAVALVELAVTAAG